MKDRLKEVRKNTPLPNNQKRTQENFANFIGLSKSSVIAYETGNRIPNNIATQLICEKCSVNETWLLTGEGDMLDVTTNEQRIAQVVSALTIESDVVKFAMITALARMKEDSLRDILKLIVESLGEKGVDISSILNE